MKDSIGILLEAVPKTINVERLKNDLSRIDGVRFVINERFKRKKKSIFNSFQMKMLFSDHYIACMCGV